MTGKALLIGVGILLFEFIAFFFLTIEVGISGAIEMAPMLAIFFLTAVIATCTVVIVESIKNLKS